MNFASAKPPTARMRYRESERASIIPWVNNSALGQRVPQGNRGLPAGTRLRWIRILASSGTSQRRNLHISPGNDRSALSVRLQTRGVGLRKPRALFLRAPLLAARALTYHGNESPC